MSKKIKIITIVIVSIVILWITIFGIDFYRCSNNEKPIFAVLSLYDKMGDLGINYYVGLGYRVELWLARDEIMSVSMFIFNNRVI